MAVMRWLGPFFVFFLILAGVATWYVTGPGRPDPAAWVQAIWSVVAVILAVLAPIWHAEVQQRAEYRRLMKLLGEIVVFAHALLRRAEEAAQSDHAAMDFRDTFNLSHYEAAMDALTAFPVTAFQNEEEISHLLLLRTIMAQTVELLRTEKARLVKVNTLLSLSYPSEMQEVLERIGRLRQAAQVAIEALIPKKQKLWV